MLSKVPFLRLSILLFAGWRPLSLCLCRDSHCSRLCWLIWSPWDLLFSWWPAQGFKWWSSNCQLYRCKGHVLYLKRKKLQVFRYRLPRCEHIVGVNWISLDVVKLSWCDQKLTIIINNNKPTSFITAFETCLVSVLLVLNCFCSLYSCINMKQPGLNVRYNFVQQGASKATKPIRKSYWVETPNSKINS